MRKIRIAALLLAAALAASALAGCGETKAQTNDKPAQRQEQQAPENGRGTMAKVVSLDGDRLTVILADRPDGGGSGTPPANGTPPAMDARPENGGGTPADQPGQSGQGGGKIQFTGEEKTYTLSGDVVVMKGTGDSAAEIDLSELAADDVIRFTTTTDDSGNEVINAIAVME